MLQILPAMGGVKVLAFWRLRHRWKVPCFKDLKGGKVAIPLLWPILLVQQQKVPTINKLTMILYTSF